MIEVDVEWRRGTFALKVAFANSGGITALFGRSGSGKTSVINLIAGLDRPDRGRIVLDGRVLVDTDRGVFVRKHRRRIGLVFQDAQLFPHLSVRHNLLFGRWFAPSGEQTIALDAVVETLGIASLLHRRPAQLSGGEKQRVALGRALLAGPRVLLMDEPLAALDMPRKLEVLPLIERLRDHFGTPIVYVSHAIEEVARLAASVVVLEKGKVRAVGPPSEVFGLVDETVDADQHDLASVLDATVGAYDAAYGLTPLHHPAGTVFLTGRVEPAGRPVRIVVRATNVALATRRPDHLSTRTVLEGTVARIGRDGGPLASVGIGLRGSGWLTALATRKAIEELDLAVGDEVFALVKSVAMDARPIGGDGAISRAAGGALPEATP